MSLRWLDPSDFPEIPDAGKWCAQVEVQALADVPCLANIDPANIESLKLVLGRVVYRWASQGWSGAKSQSGGGFSVDWSVTPGTLSSTETATLRGLCPPGSDCNRGMSRAAFPEAQPWDRLFTRPRWGENYPEKEI